MLERFRGLWAALMKPGATVLAKLGVHPDWVTVTGTVLLVATAFICVPRGWLWQGALIMTAFVLTDGLDGQLARMTNQVSPFGAFLDSSLDRVADGAIFGVTVLWLLGGRGEWWAASIALWALIMGQVTSYVKARAESVGYACSGGIAARGDRILILFASMLLSGLGVPYALEVGVCLLAVLSTITVGQRMMQVRRQSQAATSAS